MVNKALAYELTKIVPIEVLETYRNNPDHPNDLIKVGRTLKETHLPGWLVYAIDESDHDITGLDVKIPAYVDNETICEVAQEYSEKDEGGIINLNRPGERDWMQEDPMKPYRERFESEYETATSSIESVLNEVFGSAFDAFTDEMSREIAEAVVEHLDMFSWELYRERCECDDADACVSEWVVSELRMHELAQYYLIVGEELDDFTEVMNQTNDYTGEFVSVCEEADLRSFEKTIPLFGVIPLDDKRAALREEMVENRKE